MITKIIRRSLILLPCLHRLNFPIIKLRPDPKPTTWNLDYINFIIFLLAGPWPWAPHQNNEYIIHSENRNFLGCIRGTLHPSPLKLTPSSVFLSFDQFPHLLSHVFFFSSFHSEPWRSFGTSQVPIIEDLQLPAQGSDPAQIFIQ